jgi:hypothetical protein
LENFLFGEISPIKKKRLVPGFSCTSGFKFWGKEKTENQNWPSNLYCNGPQY